VKRRIRASLVGAVAWLLATSCLACVSPPNTPIRKQLQVATTVAVFQLESSELFVERLGPGLVMPTLRGRVRVVETLKGKPARFVRHELSIACNQLRLDVGDYFLLATTQQGDVLKLGVADATVMFISPAYGRAVEGRPYASRDFQAALDFLQGKPLPAGFGSNAGPMTQKYFVPPPCKR